MCKDRVDLHIGTIDRQAENWCAETGRAETKQRGMRQARTLCADLNAMILRCRRLYLPQDRPRLHPKRPRQHDKLHNIDPPLAAFHAGDERLMTPQAHGQLGLGKTGRLSGIDERVAQRLMA